MLDTARIIDRVANAQIVEPVRRSGMFTPRNQERVDHPVAAHRRVSGALQFGIEEGQIEHRVVRHELGIAEEIDQFS